VDHVICRSFSASSPAPRLPENRGVPSSSPGLATRGSTCKQSLLSSHLPPAPERRRATKQREVLRRAAARGAWQVAGRRREQGAISTAKLRPRDLAAQGVKLVTQDEQLVSLTSKHTTSPNERSQQGPEREVQEDKRPLSPILPTCPRRARHQYWHLQVLTRRESRVRALTQETLLLLLVISRVRGRPAGGPERARHGERKSWRIRRLQ
jgi:hypothetical protein